MSIGALILAIAVSLAPMGARGDTPVTATAPATTASSENSAVKESLRSFIRAVVNGDEKTYMGLLVFGNDDMKKSAQILLSQVGSRQRVSRAVRDVFGERSREVDIGMSDEELTDTEKRLSAAAVTVGGEEARITMQEGLVYVLVKGDGKWKVDFDRTQAGMGRLMPAAVMDVMNNQTHDFNRLAEDIRGRKFTSIEEVMGHISRIENMLSQVTTAPAVGPTAATTRKP